MRGMIHTVWPMGISALRRRQFVRGLRLAGNLLLGFVTLMFVAIGATVLTGGEPGRFGKVGDCIALLAGFWILFARADDWKTWVAGFFGFTGLCSGVGILISGHMATYPYKPVPQKDAILIVVFAVLLTAATFPTADFRRPCGPFGRALLAVAVVAFFMAVVLGPTNYTWLAVSLALFVIVRLRFLLVKHRTRNVRHFALTDAGR
jgi:hypothetical protein